MGLFKRMSDIVSANLNDMAEKYEDPEKMLKQAVREMETSIEEARRDVAKSMASDKIVAKELAENEQKASQWQQRAEAAIEAGDDNLARQALGRKQEYEKVAAAPARSAFSGRRIEHDAAPAIGRNAGEIGRGQTSTWYALSPQKGRRGTCQDESRHLCPGPE